MDPSRKPSFNPPRHDTEPPNTGRVRSTKSHAPWSDALLVALCEAQTMEDLEDAIAHLFAAAIRFAPEASFGVRIRRGGADRCVRRSSEPLHQDPTPDRLFPWLAIERPFALDGEPGSALIVASDPLDLSVACDAEDTLCGRLALAVSAVCRLDRSRRAARDAEDAAMRAHEVARQADKLAGLGQLVAGIVHELNNPVTSILAYADVLHQRASEAGIDPRDVDRLARIREAAQRIHRFSRDLVAYARPSTEVAVPLSIHDVIDRALLFCDHVLDRERVIVERAFGATGHVRGVGTQLVQVFVNLFTNAAKAMRDGGGTLRIETSNDGSMIVIAVSDTGSGIAVGAMPRLFEPFFTTSPSGEGTGLGLTIVRDILQAHNGRVWAEPAPDAGARFVVCLPRAEADLSFEGDRGE